jgi:hypothetical protein
VFLVEKPEGKRSLSTRYEYERYEGRNAEVLPHILWTPCTVQYENHLREMWYKEL